VLAVYPTSPAHPENTRGQAADGPGFLTWSQPDQRVSVQLSLPPSDINRGKIGTKSSTGLGATLMGLQMLAWSLAAYYDISSFTSPSLSFPICNTSNLKNFLPELVLLCPGLDVILGKCY
jgi:hypothetical protein